VLTFTYRKFRGRVPTPGVLDKRSQDLKSAVRDTLNTMDSLLRQCQFREAIRAAMSLAQEANRYLDEKAPWKTITGDKTAAATALFVAISVLAGLRTMLYPFLPFSSQRLHEYLGFPGRAENYGWQITEPEPGQSLLPPQPLFTKLDEALAEEETGRLGHAYSP